MLTVIDRLTKWAEATTILTKTSQAVASALLRIWVARFGVPKIIVSDNGPEFTSEVFSSLCARLGVSLIHSPPYHPEGNAPIETFHRTVRKGLVCLPPEQAEQLTFDEALQLVLMNYRAIIHLEAGETPAFLCHGVDLRPPIHSDITCRSMPMTERLQYLNAVRFNIFLRAKLKWQDAKERKVNSKDPFEVNDLVLVELPPHQLRKAVIRTKTGDKLTSKWGLPCRVVQVLKGGTRAIVQSLLTDDKFDTHISRARFINPPLTQNQQEQWQRQIEFEAKNLADSEPHLRYMLQLFFERLSLSPHVSSGPRVRFSERISNTGSGELPSGAKSRKRHRVSLEGITEV